MTSRREFLQAVGAAGFAGSALAPAMQCATSRARRLDRIGVQLYSVRTSMEDSVERTLERVAQIGYDEVEFAGYFGRSPQQVRRILDDHELTAPSTHLQLDALESDWEANADLAAAIGHQYLVVASAPQDARSTLDDYHRLADRFNRVGERAKAAGLAFGYHNHAFEFAPLDGETPYDILLGETDPALVTFEMDLYWITDGGADPLAYFRDHPGRFQLVHVKDRAADGTMTAVGAGTIDFASIFARSAEAGIRHYFVEHDNSDDPFASITASVSYLRRLEF